MLRLQRQCYFLESIAAVAAHQQRHVVAADRHDFARIQHVIIIVEEDDK